MSKHKIILPFLLASFLASGIYFLYSRHLATKSNLSAKQIDFLKSNYGQQVKSIDDASEKITIGNAHFRSRNYQEASEAYEMAYVLDPGSRTFIGLKLIDTYEKMGHFHKALSLLNEMEKLSWSEKGHARAAEIRSRILAAKAQATQ